MTRRFVCVCLFFRFFIEFSTVEWHVLQNKLPIGEIQSSETSSSSERHQTWNPKDKKKNKEKCYVIMYQHARTIVLSHLTQKNHETLPSLCYLGVFRSKRDTNHIFLFEFYSGVWRKMIQNMISLQPEFSSSRKFDVLNVK